MLTSAIRTAARSSTTSTLARSTLRSSRTTILPALTQRSLSSSTVNRAATSHDDHGHESHYDPPGGWLWGIPPGEKYEYEGWEWPMWIGFCGTLTIATIIVATKEDTSIQTWALEEARRRLEKEGILEDTNP